MELSLEGNRLILGGYPEGSTVHGLSPELGEPLLRLISFIGDLEKVTGWMALLDHHETPRAAREAIFIAALIKLCGCFEGTSGVRRRPLRAKIIYSPEQRATLKRLKKMRDKMAAHDDQLYPGVFPLVVLDAGCTAIHAVALNLSVPLHAFEPEVRAVAQLSGRALEFASTEFEKAAQAITEAVDALDHTEKLQIKSAGEFRLDIKDADLLGD